MFNLKAFELLPNSLKSSDYVDFLLLLNNDKHCVRLGFNDTKVYSKLAKWCKTFNFSYIVSSAGYMYVSKHKIIAYLAKMLDDSTFNHTLFLGIVLGYPLCCSCKMASVGENHIDEYEKNFIKFAKFQNPYNLINPIGYTSGYSLISHIPCSNKCISSLKIAKHTYQIICQHKNNKVFLKWKDNWLN